MSHGSLVCISKELKEALINALIDQLMETDAKIGKLNAVSGTGPHEHQKIIDDELFVLQDRYGKLNQLREIAQDLQICEGQHRGAFQVWSGEI